MAFIRRKAPVVDMPDFAEQCEDLRQGIERDQEGVRVAVHELTGAAGSKLDVSEHIKQVPADVGDWRISRRRMAG